MKRCGVEDESMPAARRRRSKAVNREHSWRFSWDIFGSCPTHPTKPNHSLCVDEPPPSSSSDQQSSSSSSASLLQQKTRLLCHSESLLRPSLVVFAGAVPSPQHTVLQVAGVDFEIVNAHSTLDCCRSLSPNDTPLPLLPSRIAEPRGQTTVHSGRSQNHTMSELFRLSGRNAANKERKVTPPKTVPKDNPSADTGDLAPALVQGPKIPSQ